MTQSSNGKVVRAFHRFTLVDQSGNGRDITKGRQREQGAVKISCERQDPNARNCHGYRKFVRRSVLEAPNSGYLVDDTIVIRYEIDLVVTSGGALNKSSKQTQSFVVDIGKQMKMGEHLVKLLPPSQSWRKREKRMMLANGLGKRSLMLGGGGSNKTGGGGGGSIGGVPKLKGSGGDDGGLPSSSEKGGGNGGIIDNSKKKMKKTTHAKKEAMNKNDKDDDELLRRFEREHIDLDSEPEDDAGDEDRLALGNDGGNHGNANNNNGNDDDEEEDEEETAARQAKTNASVAAATMNNNNNNNNKRTQHQPQRLSPMDGTSFMGLDEHDLTDCCFRVEDEYFRAHKIILSARSRVFAAMLRAGWKMREGTEGVISLKDIKPKVFEILLHFVYADELPKYSKLSLIHI